MHVTEHADQLKPCFHAVINTINYINIRLFCSVVMEQIDPIPNTKGLIL